MSDILHHIQQQAAGLGEPYRQAIQLDDIRVEPGALRQAADYLAKKNYHSVIIVVDQNTFEAAGKQLAALTAITAGPAVHTTMIRPDSEGDVIADEASIIQLILDIQHFNAEAVVAVGGGTLHDICRYSAYTTGIPFVSVPTAPSVDGFNSKGAPIILRGEKQTIPAIGPMAIFADLDILAEAPAPLVAAGFGDMLGKYTSLFDWRFGAAVAGEPYLPLAAEITRSALQKCVDSVDLIAKRSEEGVRILMTALIESGLAMLLFGQSHPASGAEHHLSHYWEMEYLRLRRRQLLHGAKVGVACMEISKLYHQLAAQGLGLDRGDNINGGSLFAGENEAAAAIHSRLAENREELCREIGLIPDSRTLGELLAAVGGPTSPGQLGISAELLERSLQEAHRVRPGRSTLLKLYNEERAARI